MFEIQRPIPAAKPLGAVLAALAFLISLAGPAGAETQTVQGTGGDLQKMSVFNQPNAVVAKLYGSDIECGVSRWVDIQMRDRDGTKYTAMGGCYPGDPASGGGWHKSLERGATLVKCGFTLKYNTTDGFWRFEVPRSCLAKLGNQIRVVKAEVVATATPGEAGPTRWLSRG
ncbi:MAG: hypothetical protein ACJ72P_06075 [Nocardioides sp.]|jgi:hypothetical protein